MGPGTTCHEEIGTFYHFFVGLGFSKQIFNLIYLQFAENNIFKCLITIITVSFVNRVEHTLCFVVKSAIQQSARQVQNPYRLFSQLFQFTCPAYHAILPITIPLIAILPITILPNRYSANHYPANPHPANCYSANHYPRYRLQKGETRLSFREVNLGAILVM